jgi:hypothetical protein
MTQACTMVLALQNISATAIGLIIAARWRRMRVNDVSVFVYNKPSAWCFCCGACSRAAFCALYACCGAFCALYPCHGAFCALYTRRATSRHACDAACRDATNDAS